MIQVNLKSPIRLIGLLEARIINTERPYIPLRQLAGLNCCPNYRGPIAVLICKTDYRRPIMIGPNNPNYSRFDQAGPPITNLASTVCQLIDLFSLVLVGGPQSRWYFELQIVRVKPLNPLVCLLFLKGIKARLVCRCRDPFINTVEAKVQYTCHDKERTRIKHMF